MRRATAVAAAIFAAVCATAAAQDMEPYHEYDKKVRSAEQIGALSQGLFGDQINVYDQSTVFRHVDIDVPGNNPLPVTLARKLVIRPVPAIGVPPERYAGAGDWDIDVPFISGVFDAMYGWNTGIAGAQPRCSTNFYPKTLSPRRIENIWSGYTVNIPGESARTLIGYPAEPFVKPDGAVRRWTTASMDTVSCTPMVSGYPGEGFVLETTAGIKYFFNKATTRTAGVMRSGAKSVPRVEVFLLASRIEDRFGNSVNYTYNSNGHATIIEASDGRRIDLAYSGNRLDSATAHGRTWIYGYNGALLHTVELPDSSMWRFEHPSNMRLGHQPWTEDPGPGCGTLPPLELKDYSLQVYHPAGAEGTFNFSHKRNFRAGIPSSFCQSESQPSGPVRHYLDTPFHFDTFSLISKIIQGPGISVPLIWSYQEEVFGEDPPGLWSGTVPPCLSCLDSKLISIRQPDGSTVSERYGVIFALNEGKLLERRVAGSSGIISTESLAYISDAEVAAHAFPDRYGSLWGGSDESAVKIRPLKSRVIAQQGVSFEWAATDFDTRGRATISTRSSSLPGSPSRTETTTYHDNLSKWILGQVTQVTCTASNPASAGCDGGTGSVMLQTTYDTLYSQPQVTKKFGRTVQVLGYNTTSTIASGQLGTLRTVADGNGQVTTVSDWERGVPQSIQYPGTPEAPGGATRSAVVDYNGWITSVTDENGSTTAYDYDDMGRLKRINYPENDSVDWADTELAFEYINSPEHGIPAGHWRHTIATGNARTVNYFDALLRPLVRREYDIDNVVGTQRFTRWTYDHEGRVTFASYPGTSEALTAGTWTYYDALGRPEQVTQDSELGPLSTFTAYLTGLRTEVTPPRGADFRTTTSYLAWDQPTTDFPVAITHPTGAFTDIARDAFGKPTEITRRNSSASVALTRSYVYDARQLLCKSIEPETRATIMDYDGAGNLLWSKAGAPQVGTGACNTADIPSAQRIVRTYDGRNWLRTLSFPDGRGDQTWSYAPDGLPTSITTYNSNGGDIVSNSYDYNRRRLLERETFAVGGKLWSLDYSYNALGHMDSHVSPGGTTVAFLPNALGQPTQAGTYATAVEYFPNGGMKQFIYGNGIRHSLSQNTRGLPDTSCDHAGSSCGAGAVLNDGYDYDAHGNVQAISDGRSGNRGHRTMAYDGLDRLTSAVSGMFGAASYSYDVLDNLKTVHVTAGSKARSLTYVYDHRNALTNVTETSGGATVIGLDYDAQGNLENKNGTDYVFDFGNRLRAAGGLEQYSYDGHGRRVVAVRNGDALYSVYGWEGTLRFQRDERTGKTVDYVHLNGSLVAQVENAIPLSTPTLTVPGSSQTGSYTVRWTESPMATRYQLQERVDSGGWTTIHDAGGSGRVATIKLVSGRTSGLWDYQIRACSATACGSWSPVRTVTVQLPPSATPTLTAPALGPGGSYTLNWSGIAAATTYQLEEQPSSGSWSPIHNAAGVSKAVTGRAAGPWHYRVRACNASGCGGWSATKAVQSIHPPASAPALTVPATNAVGSYTVAWTSISTSDRYELQERQGTGSWVSIHDAAATSKALTGKTTGDWGYRIRACNVAGCTGYTAEKIVVVTRPPVSAPTLTVPASDTTGSYTVSWTAVAAATTYQLQERQGAGGWSTIHDAAGRNTAVSGKGSGTWGYQVRGCNSSGCGDWSQVKAVVVTRPPAAPIVTYAHNHNTIQGTIVTPHCEIRWTTIADAASYEMKASGGLFGLYSGPNASVAGASYCAPNYIVRACNAAGCSAWSAQRVPTYSEEIIPPGGPLRMPAKGEGDGT